MMDGRKRLNAPSGASISILKKRFFDAGNLMFEIG